MPAITIYTTSLRPSWRTDAARGGPHGEIRMVDDLTEGLRAIGCGVRRIPSLRWFYARQTLTRLLRARRGLLVLDPWTLELAVRHRLLDDDEAARLRILEWYGTPAALVSTSPRGLRSDQYVLPYPDSRHGNRWIGFLLRDDDGRALRARDSLADYVQRSMAGKKRQGVVWGKESRYFTEPVRRVLDDLSRHCELHVTLSSERLGGVSLGDRFINHGSMPPAEWRSLIRESAFVIGLGDPVSGPTAIEALAAGCAYLNPTFTPPRRINDVAGVEAASQHPYAAQIPPPFVCPISFERPDEIIDAASQALARVGRSAPPTPEELAPLLDGLEPFTWQPYLKRVAAVFDLATK